jgi:hypothetical protein
MKISIGDIIDRYSICQLKKERLSIDNEKEINSLKNEMDKYDDIKSFSDDLYRINGLIWDLESDIRKKNENILGLEEVGRRAIKIRELNSERVSIKNKINAKFKEGFVEVKMNHGSHKEPSVIVSLTTVPERLEHNHEQGLISVLKSLCEQDDDDYEVHINIPFISKFSKKEYIIPEWIEEYKLKYNHLKVFRTEDFGPPTKLIPTVQRILNGETIIIVVDDDLIYQKNMISEHRKNQIKYVNSVIAYDGIGCREPNNKTLFNSCTYKDYRNHFICCVMEPTTTKIVQHYKSVSYKKKLFKDNFFKDFVGKTHSDDVLVSYYFRFEKIDMIIVPYEPEIERFNTYENWNKNKGVDSFPVIKHAHGPMQVGTKNPEMIKVEPRFFVPDEFKKIN